MAACALWSLPPGRLCCSFCMAHMCTHAPWPCPRLKALTLTYKCMPLTSFLIALPDRSPGPALGCRALMVSGESSLCSDWFRQGHVTPRSEIDRPLHPGAVLCPRKRGTSERTAHRTVITAAPEGTVRACCSGRRPRRCGGGAAPALALSLECYLCPVVSVLVIARLHV